MEARREVWRGAEYTARVVERMVPGWFRRHRTQYRAILIATGTSGLAAVIQVGPWRPLESTAEADGRGMLDAIANKPNPTDGRPIQ